MKETEVNGFKHLFVVNVFVGINRRVNSPQIRSVHMRSVGSRSSCEPAYHFRLCSLTIYRVLGVASGVMDLFSNIVSEYFFFTTKLVNSPAYIIKFYSNRFILD